MSCPYCYDHDIPSVARCPVCFRDSTTIPDPQEQHS